MIDFEVSPDFPPGSIRVDSVTTSRPTKPGLPAVTKTRSLSCACISVLAARGLSPLGEKFFTSAADRLAATAHPFLVILAGTHAQVQGVAANLRAGRRAMLLSGSSVEGYIEMPPRAGYRSQTLRGEDGTVVTTLYLPWTIQRAPEERPDDKVSIANLVPRWWMRDNVELMRKEFGSEAEEAAIAAWVVDRLDRYTQRPVLADMRFRLWLFREASKESGLFRSFETFDCAGATMCWPKGSGKVIWAHTGLAIGKVEAIHGYIEDKTREWVRRR